MTDFQDHLTETALKNGALVVGYTMVRRTQPVMVLAFPFSNSWILNHPFYITRRFVEALWHEHKLHQKLTEILQKEGYRAKVKSSMSVFGDFRPLAVAAGIGQWGKNGLVVNKTYGSRLLLSAVFTDAPLIASDHSGGHPDYGIDDLTHGQNSGNLRSIQADDPSFDLCQNCDQCIRSCPGGAFAGGVFHPKKCVLKSIRGCSECIQVCTGKKSPGHTTTLWI